MAYFPVTPSGALTKEEARPRLAWPKLVAAAVLLGALMVTALFARARTGGAFVYPVDDAYIHLAAARRFVESGDRTFLAASSSIAWPWLLVVMRELGVHDHGPLILNAAFAIALFFSLESALTQFGSRHASSLSLLLLLLVPIVPLALSGMEHTAHAFCVVALALRGSRAAARHEKIRVPLLCVAAAAVAFRYESGFVVAALVLLFMRARRIRDAALLGAAAAFPALVSGFFSVMYGGTFIPAPILLKRTHLDALALPANIYYRLIDNPHVLVTFVLLAFAFKIERSAIDPKSPERRALVFIAIVTLAFQTALAQLGWFYRYEAYAMVVALLAITATAITHRSAVRAFVIPLAVLALPLVGRGLGAFRTTVLASQNIFDQEMQMAFFIRDFYDDKSVALNDIGAVAYVSNAHVVDLMGLASPHIAHARGMRIDGPLAQNEIESIGVDEKVSVAILYEDWFVGTLPPTWKKIGSWKISDNHVCAKDTVTFYGTDETAAAVLRENLRAFTTRLPTSITQAPLDH
ncbi:MAG: hypothetical protein ABI183_12905 [Polyangiaceae bacterium]